MLLKQPLPNYHHHSVMFHPKPSLPFVDPLCLEKLELLVPLLDMESNRSSHPTILDPKRHAQRIVGYGFYLSQSWGLTK